MPATVVAFRYRLPEKRRRVPSPSPAPPRCRVIRLPDPSDSVTAHDLGLLAALIASPSGEWLLETQRDGNWDLSAVLARRVSAGQDYAAFLVSRRGGRLRLVDARLSARWRTLGVFDDIAELAHALRPLIR
jgi:hypothetical protein